MMMATGLITIIYLNEITLKPRSMNKIDLSRKSAALLISSSSGAFLVKLSLSFANLFSVSEILKNAEVRTFMSWIKTVRQRQIL